jgi:hypothetical protein
MPFFSRLLASAAPFALAATAAHADVVLSSKATQNMVCSAGVCSPAAADAVLNVGDLETMLASGSVEVTTTGSGVQANNIDVTSALKWTALHALTLDAYQSIGFTAAGQNDGTGGVSLVTNDGGNGGALSFLPGGSFGFASTTAPLMINGKKYKLEQSLERLIYDVVANPGGAFALANSTDASQDGVYDSSPIGITFGGKFNGLGNAITGLEIQYQGTGYVGLFTSVKKSGVLSSVRLENVVIRSQGSAGALAGSNAGLIVNSSSSGTIESSIAGGLVQNNKGTVTGASSSAKVKGRSAGGLIGENYGTVEESFATGRVSGSGDAGGLVGYSDGPILNSYATGGTYGSLGSVGGLVGTIDEKPHGSINTSYATGVVQQKEGEFAGGFLGVDENDAGTIANCYWDTTTSGTTQGDGDGSEAGITGLTTQQLQSGLPTGFDSTIWAENPKINNGFPYLIANPPPK